MTGRRPLATINVTPLVDVLLILLVVLMLTLPLMARRLPVELPRTGVNAVPAAVSAMRVALAADGAVYLGETRTTLPAVVGQVRHDTTVELAIDAAVSYQRIAEAVSALQEARPREVLLLSR